MSIPNDWLWARHDCWTSLWLYCRDKKSIQPIEMGWSGIRNQEPEIRGAIASGPGKYPSLLVRFDQYGLGYRWTRTCRSVCTRPVPKPHLESKMRNRLKILLPCRREAQSCWSWCGGWRCGVNKCWKLDIWILELYVAIRIGLRW